MRLFEAEQDYVVIAVFCSEPRILFHVKAKYAELARDILVTLLRKMIFGNFGFRAGEWSRQNARGFGFCTSFDRLT